jgi:hypothetical protein
MAVDQVLLVILLNVIVRGVTQETNERRQTASWLDGERNVSASGECDWYFETQNKPATKLPKADNIDIRIEVRDTTLRSEMARNATVALRHDQCGINCERKPSPTREAP